MLPVNIPLLELFRAHGIEADSQAEWILFPGRTVRANASIVRETVQNSGISVQLDVRLDMGLGRIIVESFAGFGETREQAIAHAFRSFAANSFHVFLAVFFGCHSPQVSQEDWVIGGRTSRVTIGGVGVSGKPPVQGEQSVDWFNVFAEKIKEKQLRPGTHWVRLYYGQRQRRAVACEVLLDNHVWDGLQSEMAAFDWPSGEAFYSVRIFLVVQVWHEGSVTPESAVAWLADIVAAGDNFTEAEVIAALGETGVSSTLADRAYMFTQAAWGRAFLAGLGLHVSPDYVCFNASGHVVESGRLADEPCFAAASRLAEQYAGTAGFRRLALMSADVNAVNHALKSGSKPEDLVLTPVFLYLEALTPDGIEHARLVIDQYVASLREKASSKAQEPAVRAARKWWRF